MQQIEYNAGNFQEYDYETEWLECDWKAVHKTLHLVTAFWYPLFTRNKRNKVAVPWHDRHAIPDILK